MLWMRVSPVVRFGRMGKREQRWPLGEDRTRKKGFYGKRREEPGNRRTFGRNIPESSALGVLPRLNKGATHTSGRGQIDRRIGLIWTWPLRRNPFCFRGESQPVTRNDWIVLSVAEIHPFLSSRVTRYTKTQYEYLKSHFITLEIHRTVTQPLVSVHYQYTKCNTPCCIITKVDHNGVGLHWYAFLINGQCKYIHL